MSDTPEQPGQAPADQQAAAPVASAQDDERKELRAEAAKYRTERNALRSELDALKGAQEAQKRAEAEKAGEYQTLYEREKARAAELEPHRERAERLEAALAQHVKELARDLPEDLRALMPDAPAEAQLDWLGKARKAAAKLTEQRTPGTPAGPRGNGSVSGATDINAEMIAQKRRQISGF